MNVVGSLVLVAVHDQSSARVHVDVGISVEASLVSARAVRVAQGVVLVYIHIFIRLIKPAVVVVVKLSPLRLIVVVGIALSRHPEACILVSRSVERVLSDADWLYGIGVDIGEVVATHKSPISYILQGARNANFLKGSTAAESIFTNAVESWQTDFFKGRAV